jgi:hypothetical protein
MVSFEAGELINVGIVGASGLSEWIRPSQQGLSIDQKLLFLR